MNIDKVEESLENLVENFSKETFIFDLLMAYGIPKSTITLLKNSPSKLSGKENQIILKNKLFFDVETTEDVHATIDTLQKDASTRKHNPRFIIVTNYETLLAVDTKTNETLDIKIKDIAKHYAFFLPWAGMEKTQHANENPADIKAAYRMAKLYDQIITDNPNYLSDSTHDLNIFLSRLLFCFFAEDTGIFKAGIFTNSLDSHTQNDGQDLGKYLTNLFNVLNTKENERVSFAHHFTEFPYVNGGLFEKQIALPTFTTASRELIVECGKLGWEAINPDIFGSMIQAVVHPGQRENLGMHYTSVPNIMKVIEPLFLNDLYEELENSANDFKKLTKLRERISKIKIFDPACGSGNFLIISYKELCKLEIKILEKIKDLGEQAMPLSGISLNSFHGIEIDDFAHEIARLSLWLAQHQMNTRFDDAFGMMKPTLPLKESGKIICGNSIRLDWNEVCPRADYKSEPYEIYVIGNPPYLGSRNQEEDQKEDLKSIFVDDYKSLDYISAWFYKGAKYISGFEKIKLAFVSTNSITQGEQVALLWPRIFGENVEICFAYQSFKWQNLAKGNAGVTCVIIGLSSPTTKTKRLYNNSQYINAKNINPYLTEGDSIYIRRRSKPLSHNFPVASFGNMPNDGGNLIFSEEEKNRLIFSYPKIKNFIYNYVGAEDFLQSKKRFCLAVPDNEVSGAINIPEIRDRFKNVTKIRASSSEKSTREKANTPNQFYFWTHKEGNSIIIPSTTSERRDYVPMGFLNSQSVVSNSAQVIYNPEPYIFGVLTSLMHMVWIRAVGGKLEDRLRYSSALCYNTFPFPEITDKQKESIATHVYNILEERERNPNKTMAELYDPDNMPDGLRQAHKYLDTAIDQIYRNKPFESDEERLAHLFKLYEEMITNEPKK